MEKFVPSTFDENRHPIRIGHGSLLPGEILERLWIVARRKITKDKPISAPVRIHRGYLGTASDYSKSYPDRLFSRWIGKPDGSIVFETPDDGDPKVMIVCGNGEKIEDATVLAGFTGEDITCLKRVDSPVGIPKSSAVITALYGVFAVFSDMIPVWSEISAIAGIAAVSLQRRVRCLIELKPEPEAAADQKQPFLIVDLPEVAFMLLDACVHQPIWKEAPVAAGVEEHDPEESDTPEEPVADPA